MLGGTRHRIRWIHSKAIRSRLHWLIRTPLFWWITIWGNSCIFGGALAFHFLEVDKNPDINSFLDSLVWAVGLVTTVGAGDVQPVTVFGKILSILCASSARSPKFNTPVALTKRSARHDRV